MEIVDLTEALQRHHGIANLFGYLSNNRPFPMRPQNLKNLHITLTFIMPLKLSLFLWDNFPTKSIKGY